MKRLFDLPLSLPLQKPGHFVWSAENINDYIFVIQLICGKPVYFKYQVRAAHFLMLLNKA